MNTFISADQQTADAFATSWNNLPAGSVYTPDQVQDWLEPLHKEDFEGMDVLELGCGNGSLLVHLVAWNAKSLTGVDLGNSVKTAEENMAATGFTRFKIVKCDLIIFESPNRFDVVYSIGVLHHLKEPYSGFDSVLRNTKPGGRFHCWVYAKEGNSIIIWVVDPIRKVASALPWWLTKYFVATPLAALYFVYAHLITALRLSFMPLYLYSKWITKRNFLFFRHVAFDQLVTPSTVYLDSKTIEEWLKDERINPDSAYKIFRNGNSWKFGGQRSTDK